MDAHSATGTAWQPASKVLFRFFFAYFVIYCFPFPVDAFDLTTPIVKPYYNFLDWLIAAIGKNWFHIHVVPAFPTFDKLDDSGYGLVFLYFNLLLSSVITLIWTMADRKNRNYNKLYRWFNLYLRFFLAAYLFGYGFIKVFPSQFQPITASRLTMAVGDQSPMLLAWNFMGYSPVFTIINGLVEVIAGIFLLFRRTTTIGAILSAAAFGFIVMMDFSFNVPVRLLASHFLFLSVYLIWNDGKRLLNLLFLNKPTEPIVLIPLVSASKQRRILNGALITLATCLFVSSAAKGIIAARSFGYYAKRVPMHGVYRTEYFIRNGDTIPPLESDNSRWKQLVIDGGSWNQWSVVFFTNDAKKNYNLIVDSVEHELNFQSQTDTTEKYTLHFTMTAGNRLLLNGLWMKDSIELAMKKYNLDNYVLHKEKFKWIDY